jgi:hypothetical protein
MDDITSVGYVKAVPNSGAQPLFECNCMQCLGCTCPCWPTPEVEAGVWGSTGIVVWAWNTVKIKDV